MEDQGVRQAEVRAEQPEGQCGVDYDGLRAERAGKPADLASKVGVGEEHRLAGPDDPELLLRIPPVALVT
jgi:hypothetical protein